MSVGRRVSPGEQGSWCPAHTAETHRRQVKPGKEARSGPHLLFEGLHRTAAHVRGTRKLL